MRITNLEVLSKRWQSASDLKPGDIFYCPNLDANLYIKTAEGTVVNLVTGIVMPCSVYGQIQKVDAELTITSMM